LSVIASPFGRRSNLVHQERDRHSASRRIAMTKNVNTVTSQNTLLLPQVINKRLLSRLLSSSGQARGSALN